MSGAPVSQRTMDAIRKARKQPKHWLTCCCCGNGTRGRQWWNRDDGYGLCPGCLDVNHAEDLLVQHDSFGYRGVHFDLDRWPVVESLLGPGFEDEEVEP